MAGKRLVLYARVSTVKTEKDKDGNEKYVQDPELQLRDMKEFLKANNGWEITEEYVDRISTRKANPPARNRLMADAIAHKFDAVCVWKLDRWGRSVKDIANTLDELDKLGITFLSKQDQFDLRTSTGRLVKNVLASVAELERDMISDRVKAGLRNAKAKGKKLGRPRGRFKSFSPELAQRIKGLAVQNTTSRAIANQIGVSHTTVARFLRENL